MVSGAIAGTLWYLEHVGALWYLEHVGALWYRSVYAPTVVLWCL